MQGYNHKDLTTSLKLHTVNGDKAHVCAVAMAAAIIGLEPKKGFEIVKKTWLSLDHRKDKDKNSKRYNNLSNTYSRYAKYAKKLATTTIVKNGVEKNVVEHFAMIAAGDTAELDKLLCAHIVKTYKNLSNLERVLFPSNITAPEGEEEEGEEAEATESTPEASAPVVNLTIEGERINVNALLDGLEAILAREPSELNSELAASIMLRVQSEQFQALLAPHMAFLAEQENIKEAA